jgi:glycosyltransferase involved in cell wall biosynthesis
MRTQVAAFTIFDSNYHRRAAVCLRSFAALHPNATIYALDISSRFDNKLSLYRRLSVYELGLSSTQLHNMAKIYSVTEFATALKPWAIQTLFQSENYDTVVYLDPDLYWHSPIPNWRLRDDEKISLRLTPHIINARQPDPTVKLDDIANVGSFNLGFGIFHRSALEFVELWRDHVTINAVTAPNFGRFTDQRFMDFAPSLTNVEVIRDPSYNVAYWNLSERSISKCGDHNTAVFLINEIPLTFFHFSGLDESRPGSLTRHNINQPTRHLESPALLELLTEYRAQLQKCGELDSLDAIGYLELSRRRVFPRDLALAVSLALNEIATEKGHARAIELLDSRNGLELLIAEPESASTKISQVGRILFSSRPDLQAAFTDPNTKAYVDWFYENFGNWFGGFISAKAENGTKKVEESHAKLSHSILIVSIAANSLGISAIAKHLESALNPGLVSHIQLKSPHHSSTESVPIENAINQLSKPHDLTIWCINPNSLPESSLTELISKDKCRARVGLWWWELEAPPTKWKPFLKLFDEIWTFTRFVHRSLSVLSCDQIKLVPLPLSLQARTTDCVELPYSQNSARIIQFAKTEKAHGKFIVLAKLDFLSSFDRKGIVFAIRAFLHSIGDRQDCMLLIKSTNASQDPLALEAICLEIADCNNVLLFDEILDPDENSRLYDVVDIFISLHRSEGLGLNVLEAIASGKPTIATGYGGFTDVARESEYGVVPFTMTLSEDLSNRYEPTGMWATPNSEDAGRLLYDYFHNYTEAKYNAELNAIQLQNRLIRSTQAFRSYVNHRTTHILALKSKMSNACSNRTSETSHDSATSSNEKSITAFHLEHLAEDLEAGLVGPDFDNPAATRGKVAHQFRAMIRRLTKSNREYARHVAKQAVLLAKDKSSGS